ncbi:MAG TPA: hypothetical protein VF629_09740 [Hymenobacter sp.]|jgi:hypothetical protein|uniref:hypothetical protein n=1 Tax=Hymenobacter sp. TaxID=1898978 RepID=UPI002ED9FA01
MNIQRILTSRSFENNPNYHLIYEWEDDLGAHLSVSVVDAKPFYRKVLINRYSKTLIKYFGEAAFVKLNDAVEAFGALGHGGNNLVFELYVAEEPNFTTSSRAIPVMVDFWKHTDLDRFYRLYGACKLVLISSLEAFEFLKARGCPLNIAHFPLSLSDRYRMAPGVVYPKKYDILLAGRLNVRTNQVLRDYLEAFVLKYPDVEYLYQQEINGEYYYATNKGRTIGKFQSREDYVGLLRSSKVSFYSTPGLDGGEKRTGGFNPVTPRFLELLSAQCRLLGRYPKNEETEFYELPMVCPNVSSYEEFEATLLGYLSDTDTSFAAHRQVLEKHYTSRRAQQLRALLQQQ